MTRAGVLVSNIGDISEVHYTLAMLTVDRGWAISGKSPDSRQFFLALLECFPQATTMFAEGTSIAKDVEACLRRHAEAGAFLPGPNTTWPESTKIRCLFTPALVAELASLAEIHAEPELFDHVFLYRGDDPLVWWNDAFEDPIGASSELPEHTIRAFAARLGRKYERFGKHG
jgi:hypothetical protein